MEILELTPEQTARVKTMTANSMDPQGFAEAIKKQHFEIRDFIADPMQIRFNTDMGGTLLTVENVLTQEADGLEQFPVNSWAHNQLADFTKIPRDYYGRMQKDQHGLLDTSLHTWLDSLAGKRRMVRTLDGRVRAVLSDRYRRIDNFHVANAVLPELVSAGATFRRLHVTEEEMVIQAVFTEVRASVRKVGDIILLGVTIENNEVGKGMVRVSPMSLELDCLNGMTHNNLAHKKMHVGTQLGGDGDPTEYFAQDTLEASDQALMLQLRDVTRKACDETLLHTIVADFQRSLGVPITAPPVHSVTELVNRTDLNETDGQGILGHLLAGGNFTQWGMVQAITRYAQDVPEGTRAVAVEAIGGDILSMARDQFGPIATAGEPKRRNRR